MIRNVKKSEDLKGFEGDERKREAEGSAGRKMGDERRKRSVGRGNNARE